MNTERTEELWQKIKLVILNNLKLHYLKNYPVQILHYYNPKISSLVRHYTRFLPLFVAENEADDLKTISQLEFLETLKNWDPDKCSDIWPLAQLRITGAMKDHIRFITKSNPASLHEWVTEVANFYLNMNSDKSFEHEVESNMQIQEALKKLTPREQKIVLDHVYKDKKFQEIGEKLNISESQVSRIYKKSMEKLKKHISKI
jgi:RNA polymerase sigma factor (sigma-70 family)